jgi:hypothetical protein
MGAQHIIGIPQRIKVGSASDYPASRPKRASQYNSRQCNQVTDESQVKDAAASNPHFLEDVFGEYRKLNKVRMCQIRCKISDKELPPLPNKQPMCLASWHTKEGTV